eukprot:EG_transcript_2731
MAPASQPLDVVVVGAGIVGCAAAIFIAKRGHKVDVFERRADSRHGDAYEAPSMGCCLSSRGLRALREMGVTDAELLRIGVPVHGCCIHTAGGRLSYQRDGQDSEYLGVERRGLNELLLDKCQEQPNITLHFRNRCEGVNLKKNLIRFIDEAADCCVERRYRLVIGADGAFSQVRSAIIKTGRIGYSHTYFEHVYKELTIPPTARDDYAISPGFYHLWPRGNFMMMGLPNRDKSFTLTLYMSQQARWPCFESLCHRRALQTFFRRYFPDVYDLIPNLTQEFDTRPLASLMNVSCSQYHFQDKAVVLGDAAHAVNPFLGQGANCALEDCLELNRLLQEKDDNWAEILPEFTRCRKANCDAVQALSSSRYDLMRRGLTRFPTRAFERLQGLLHSVCGSYFIPMQAMMHYHPEIPYAEVSKRAARQEKFLRQALTVIGAVVAAAAVRTSWSVYHLCAHSPAVHQAVQRTAHAVTSAAVGLLKA